MTLPGLITLAAHPLSSGPTLACEKWAFVLIIRRAQAEAGGIIPLLQRDLMTETCELAKRW